MKFSVFAQRVPKITNLPLPGEQAHYKMAPLNRVAELKAIKRTPVAPKKAAVMALFYPSTEDLTQLLLIHRKTYKGVHSNQIGFPGGKVEQADTDLLATALRETHEEVGVIPNQVSVIRSLSRIYIPPSNFEVQPYLGVLKRPTTFLKQDSEVEALVEVSFRDFMDDAVIASQKLDTSYSSNISVPAFKLNGYTVWGATAMMLSEIKDLFKQIL